MKPLPEKFEESIRQQLGTEFPRFLASLQEAPPVSIRFHPAKSKTAYRDQPVPWTRYGQYLSARPIFTLDPLFHAGSYYVQEASSMFLEQALAQTLDLSKPLNVLDLCASPGGKSTHILSLVNRGSLIISNEAIRSRASILSENIQKWGHANTIVTNNDPADFRNFTGFFDVVVVDAPCSGEGLFRKEPEAMDQWSSENVQLCASRQKRIVADVWDSLAENGLFIYCTCTYNPFENEENLRWLKQHHTVEFLKLKLDPSWGVEELSRDGVTAYRFYPNKVKGEGFFLAVLRKLEAVRPLRMKARRNIATPQKKILERLNEWITMPEETTFFQFNDLVFHTPSPKAAAFEFLLQNLKIMYAGTNVATLKHDKLIPEHALALSVEVNKNGFTPIEVSREVALAYLRRENIQLPAASMGFTLLTYEQLPLGWANVLRNRINNMYPPGWRIRMAGGSA